MANEPQHVDYILHAGVGELDHRFARAGEWSLVRRNQAITARNRAMKSISEMLDMPYREMPLERPEDAA